MTRYGKIINSITKIKTMLQKTKVPKRLLSVRTLVVALLLVALTGGGAIVHADQYDQKINALNAQNAQKKDAVSGLASQADSYKGAINALQGQVDSLTAAITANQDKQAQLQQQIVADKQQIVVKKASLADDIKTMYVDGQMTTIEELATSKNLSDYVDKEEYRTSVQNQLDADIQAINDLQAKLQKQKDQLGIVIRTQQQQNDQLASARNQKEQLLSYNQSQQAAFNSQIKANNSQIAKLREEQAAANRKLDSSGQVVTSGSCGGGYPASASGSYGPWGCDYVHSSDFQPGCSYYDSWGMCNRECVSYTAWMVYKTYGIATTGFGNANQWPGSASAAGIPTGSTPKVGSVAIYTGGYYGHAMWVVGVSGSQVHVYSYNDGYDGNFYDHWVNASGLTYIYF